MKLWAGRFKSKTNPLVDDYNASIGFDYQLAEFDILGSLAHVKMLGKTKILNEKDVNKIVEGLQIIHKKIKNKEIEFSVADEDIHMNIERHLYQIIGETAGKLHIGRSRNDQVALDLHLYLRHQIINIISKLFVLNEVILKKAEENIDTIIPGYTHLQRAEPIRFAHHLLAYFNMFDRDIERLVDNLKRVSVSPLGAGAMAGSGLKVDREYVADLLKLEKIYENSLDAVSDRDFVVEFLANASLIMMHLSKLSEEIILWCSHEFSFIQLDDAFATGSSMMPQKKNPDVAELARGKTGRVYGALMGLLTTLKGLPLAYNKDLQEDKEGLFDVVKTLSQTLDVYSPMLSSMVINKNKMQAAAENDYSNATQLANYLTTKEISFREAHEITGKIVLHCIENNFLLNALSLEVYQSFNPLIQQDVYQAISLMNVVESHQAKGGTAKTEVISQVAKAAIRLSDLRQWLCDQQALLEFSYR